MLPIINIKQRIEFVSPRDEADPKTVFVLRPMSGIESMDLMRSFKDGAMSLDKESIRSILLNSIVEIKNYDGSVDNLDTATVAELIGEVFKINGLTEDDKKKS